MGFGSAFTSVVGGALAIVVVGSAVTHCTMDDKPEDEKKTTTQKFTEGIVNSTGDVARGIIEPFKDPENQKKAEEITTDGINGALQLGTSVLNGMTKIIKENTNSKKSSESENTQENTPPNPGY